MANVKVPPFTEAPSTVVGGTPTSVFPFEFPFWSTDDILVYVDGELVDADDYSVEGFYVQGDPPAAVEGGYGSGEVTLDTAVSNVTVTIDRMVVGDRETQFSKSSPLGMPALNGDLNRVTARQQDLARRIVNFSEQVEAVEQGVEDAEAAAEAASGSESAIRSMLEETGTVQTGESVTFLARGTGAVARSTQGKLRDVANVFDFFTAAQQADAMTATPSIDTTDRLWEAIDAAAEEGVLLHAFGQFKVSDKVVFKGAADFRQATLRAVGGQAIATEISTGDADTPTTILKLSEQWDIWLPHVVNLTKPTKGWEGQGTACRVVNSQNARVWLNTLANFKYGLHVTSNGQMSAYNQFFIGLLLNNMENVRLEVLAEGDSSSVNSNTFMGGHYFHYSDEGVTDGTSGPGIYHVNIVPHPTRSIINHNVFYGGWLEGTAEEHHVRDGGQFNQFDAMRWETADGPRFHQAQSSPAQTGQGGPSIVNYGYGNDEFDYFTITADAGADGRFINNNTGLGRQFRSGPVDLLNSSASGAPTFRGFTSADLANFNDESFDRDADWSWQISDTGLEGKQTADTYARIVVDFANGAIKMGNGVSAPTAAISNFGSGSGFEVGKYAYFKEQALNAGNVAGYCPLWFDGSNFKCTLPDGTIKTLAFTA